MNKKFLSILTVLVMIFSILPYSFVQAGTDAWDGESKTEPAFSDGKYIISTGAELAWLADKVNGGDDAVNAVLSDDFVTQLGEAFAKDTTNINNGYPILKWQVKEAPSVKLSLEENTLALTDGILSGSVKVNIKNMISHGYSADIILVICNSDGSLKYLSAQPKSLSSEDSAVFDNISVSGVDEKYTVKVFAWNSINTMTSCAEPLK